MNRIISLSQYRYGSHDQLSNMFIIRMDKADSSNDCYWSYKHFDDHSSIERKSIVGWHSSMLELIDTTIRITYE